MKLPAYEEYTPSGNSWLGEVPEGWGVHSMKFSLAMPITDGPHETPEILDTGVPFISAEAVNNGQLDFAKKRGFISIEDHKKYSKKYKPARGDVYMVKSGATTGNVARVETDQEFNIWSPLAAIRPDLQKTTTDFVYYSMLSRPFLHSVELSWSYGTQQNIGMGVVADLDMAWPPVDEQHRIANFLDWKTGQIDELITKKKLLIEKLNERRAALITQAVSRGLDANAPMRDSGIPWLGEVPKHWQVMKFGYRTRIQEGQVDPEDEPYDEMLLIAPNHIESNTGRVVDLSTARDQAAISGKYLVRNGDVVYSKIRPHLNKCAVADFDGLCSADMYPIRTEPDVIPFFLQYWMLAQPFLDYATLCSMRVAMPKLNRETLSAAPLVVPPIKEQKDIIRHLDGQLKMIDSLREKVAQVIDRLSEYRVALITAATTGKIDVRKVTIGGDE